MKRRLLLMALATTMVASVFTGCGSSKDEDTTPATSVEQDSNSNVDDTTKEDATSKDDSSKEEVKGYDEVFYDEPDWAVEYEGKSESYIEEKKLEYDAMKFVFEDMTKKFKNKEEVTATDSIDLIGMGKDCEGTSLVCDVAELVPEGSPYTKFGGFNAKKTEFSDVKLEREGYVVVELNANYIQIGDVVGNDYSPMWISVFVTINEDGTYSYKEINIQYMLK